MLEFFTSYFVLFAIVIFVASIVQGILGFAFCLVSAPILIYFLDIKVVVPLLIILFSVHTLIMLITYYKYVDIKRVMQLFFPGIIGAFVGVKLLLFFSSALLEFVLYLFIIGFSLLLLFGYSTPIKKDKYVSIPVGFFSGLFGSLYSISGPPVVLFLNNQGVLKNEFKATCIVFFMLVDLSSLAFYYYHGLLTPVVYQLSIALVGFMIVGCFIGLWVSKYFSETFFKKIVLYVVLMSTFSFLVKFFY